MPGLVMGSIHYMSPEQVLGRAIDHRSDIFSLGVVLYEMTSGRLPFEGPTPTETMDRILHADPQPFAEFNSVIPPGLERIIRRSLEKEVAARYPSARELITDLNRVARGEFPVGAGATEIRHNLPVQLTTFIGRDREIEDIQQLLSTTRLLTLTGAGGCGKTRLALEVAAQLRTEYRDGVWLVDLAPLSDANLVTQTAASVLRLQEGPNRSLIEMLTDFVRHRHLLFVLDNCEHVIGSCAQLSEMLLQAGADVRILATSREALGVPGEAVWRVPSLSLPAAGQSLAVEDLLSFEAVRLFSERARSVAPEFRLNDNNAATVVEICGRLDGIPLAIELAAARLKVLSLDQINSRLKDRFRQLTGGSRTAMARQRTLEATVDWSYELLTDAERRLMCRLSVFAGGWTLEAAEEVCSGDGIERGETLDLLAHLVDKSLVNVDKDAEGTRRYRFLETVRQYARERLLRFGDAERPRDVHFGFFLNFARRIEPELQ
jgi:predicted ATPase